MASPDHTLSSARLPTHEAVRKALHIASAAIPGAYATGMRREMLESVLAAATALALSIEVARRLNPGFREKFNRITGRLLRRNEQHSLTGATWLALSCLVAVAVLSRGAAIAALWCVTVGDPAATIVGTMWPIRVGARTAKSISGSLACVAASFVGVWLIAGFSPASAAVIAAAAAAAEMVPVRIDDNVRVTAVAGAIAQLLA